MVIFLPLNTLKLKVGGLKLEVRDSRVFSFPWLNSLIRSAFSLYILSAFSYLLWFSIRKISFSVESFVKCNSFVKGSLSNTKILKKFFIVLAALWQYFGVLMLLHLQSERVTANACWKEFSQVTPWYNLPSRLSSARHLISQMEI